MTRIDPELINWRSAKKVQPIKAKPLINLMVDSSVLSKFLLDTLEGRESLGDGVVICVGGVGDAWQQMPNKLLAKYDVVGIDKDGWMICNPKPENSIHVIEVTESMVQDERGLPMDGVFYIIGHFGEPSEEGPKQTGVIGDFIGQNRNDPTDIWVIRRKIFLNTYQMLT